MTLSMIFKFIEVYMTAINGSDISTVELELIDRGIDNKDLYTMSEEGLRAYYRFLGWCEGFPLDDDLRDKIREEREKVRLVASDVFLSGKNAGYERISAA